MTAKPLAEALEEAFQHCRDMDASLNERLQALADAVRTLSPTFAEAVDRLVSRLEQSGAGASAPGPGDPMPPFVLPDDKGRLVSLEQLLRNGPAAVVFHRGHWCPYCRISADALAQAQKEVQDEGGQIVAIMPDREVQAWNAPGQVWSVAVSPDGRLLATGGTDNDISLWRAETSKLIRRLQGHEQAITWPRGLAFSPSGQRLASASSDRTARIWDVETGETLQIFRGHTDDLDGVAFGGDEDHIATTSDSGDRRAALWDVTTGRMARTFTGHSNAVTGIGHLISGAQPDAATPASQETRPLLVTGSYDRTLRVWDTETGVTLRVSEGHLSGVTGITVHTPREIGIIQVFSASNDGTVRRWEIAPLPHQHLLDMPGEALSAAIAPDCSRVAIGFADGSLCLYTLPAGGLLAEVKKAHDNAIGRLVFDSAGAVLASASDDRSARVWSVSDDGELTLQQTFTGHSDSVYAVALSPDGKTLATASHDGQVALFEIGIINEGLFIEAHEGQANSVAFDTGGAKLLSAGYEDRIARLWDLTTNPPSPMRAFSETQGQLMWAALSPENRLVAIVGRGLVVDIYGADDGQLNRRLVGHEQAVYRAIFSPDGRQLATVSSDATVRLWDLDTAAELFTLRLPAEPAASPPLWDFDFRCTPKGCWLAVPLTRGKLALYDLGAYAE